jgi:hypothetical protein
VSLNGLKYVKIGYNVIKKILYNMTLNEEWRDIPGYEGLY